MRLLNVRAVLDRESNIANTVGVSLHYNVLEELDDTGTEYAILSHRWGKEVNYSEMVELTTMPKEKRNEVRRREGYQKILKSCEQAVKDALEWLWVDTCCIDKRSSSELSEAVNSMFRWYQNSKKCYVYLHDLTEPTLPKKADRKTYGNSNGWPEWFSRGWTLQELIAPEDVQFFNKGWARLGTKRSLEDTLWRITRIPPDVLLDSAALRNICVAQIMSWAADRKTSRVEDRAYSLLGLFGVSMPMLYGEGKRAFQRIQLEIMRASNDHSIFAWGLEGSFRRPGSVLADDPSYFWGCGNIHTIEPDRFIEFLKEDHQPKLEASGVKSAQWGHGYAHQLYAFSVTNGGISICLPLTCYHKDSPVYKATLACGRWALPPVSIDLVRHGAKYYRFFGTTEISRGIPQFRQVYLACYWDQTCRNFTFDDTTISHYGFTRCGAFPRDLTGNSITMALLPDDLIVVVYANDNERVRFAVALGYHCDKQWVHVVCDKLGFNRLLWEDYAKETYERLWNLRAVYAASVPQEQAWDPSQVKIDYCIKHAHLPQSILAAKATFGPLKTIDSKVTVDVNQCTGCCYGPLTLRTTTRNLRGLPMPTLMLMDIDHSCSHLLILDGTPSELLECASQEIALGDYGNWDRGSETLTRNGNIFVDLESLAPTLGIDPANSAYRPVERTIDQFCWGEDHVQTFVLRGTHKPLALCRPVSYSLPTSRDFALLLKASSARFKNKYIVTTVVQCSSYCALLERTPEVDSDGSEHSGSHSASIGSQNISVLYDIAKPQAWDRDAPDTGRIEQYKEIRQKFSVLLNSRFFAVTENGRMPTQDDDSTNDALSFFSHIFGIKHLENYVGDITFKNLTRISEPKSSYRAAATDVINLSAYEPLLPGRPSVVLGETRGNNESEVAQDPCDEELNSLSPEVTQSCTRVPPSPSNSPEVAQAALIEALTTRLLKNIRTEGAPFKSHDKRKIKRKAVSISNTLGFAVLEDFCTAISANASRYLFDLFYTSSARGREMIKHGVDCESCNIGAELQHITTLQDELDKVNDEDEKRALEEDITGKILWVFWAGLHREVKDIPVKIVDRIFRGATDDQAWMRVRALHDTREIFLNVLAKPVNDTQAHLRRIMADASAGTSKYDLLRSARAVLDFEVQHPSYQNSDSQVQQENITHTLGR